MVTNKEPDGSDVPPTVADRLAEQYEDCEMLKMDGYDDCVAGVCLRFGQQPILIYDYTKVIEKNMQGGMSRDEAVEWFEYNQIGAWVGDGTPAFIVMANDALGSSDEVEWDA